MVALWQLGRADEERHHKGWRWTTNSSAQKQNFATFVAGANPLHCATSPKREALTDLFTIAPIRSRSRMQNTEFADRIGRIARPMPRALLFRGLDGEKVAILQELHGPQRRAQRDTQIVRAQDPAAPLITISQAGLSATVCWLMAGARS